MPGVKLPPVANTRDFKVLAGSVAINAIPEFHYLLRLSILDFNLSSVVMLFLSRSSEYRKRREALSSSFRWHSCTRSRALRSSLSLFLTEVQR